jgi:hypothetical protein
MYDCSFTLKERRKEALPRIGGYVVAILCVGRMIKIPQHKTDKVKRGERGTHRNAAIFVLSQGQVRYGVFQFPDDLCAGIEIEAQWKWHNILHDDLGVHLIRDVDLRVVLELLKMVLTR